GAIVDPARGCDIGAHDRGTQRRDCGDHGAHDVARGRRQRTVIAVVLGIGGVARHAPPRPPVTLARRGSPFVRRAAANPRGPGPAFPVGRFAGGRRVGVGGPPVSWLCAIGTTPARLISPTVGFRVTRPSRLAGDNSEPEVSVPIAGAASPAATATADPALD